MKLKREQINDINVLYLEGSLTVATAQDVFSQIVSLQEDRDEIYLAPLFSRIH